MPPVLGANSLGKFFHDFPGVRQEELSGWTNQDLMKEQIAGRRPRLRRTLQCPVDRRKERLPEPRSSSSGVARRDLNQARRVRQTCVQGTGCATTRVPNARPHSPTESARISVCSWE